MTNTASRGQPLTRREIEVLELYSIGYKTKRIALDMGITEATLREYLKSAATKLDTKTVTHAVARGLRDKLFD